jgi:hypothetical protein
MQMIQLVKSRLLENFGVCFTLSECMRVSTPVVCSIHAALTAARVLAVLPSGKAIAVELQAA